MTFLYFRQLFGVFDLFPSEFRRDEKTESQLLQFDIVHIHFSSSHSAIYTRLLVSNRLDRSLLSKGRFQATRTAYRTSRYLINIFIIVINISLYILSWYLILFIFQINSLLLFYIVSITMSILYWIHVFFSWISLVYKYEDKECVYHMKNFSDSDWTKRRSDRMEAIKSIK